MPFTDPAANICQLRALAMGFCGISGPRTMPGVAETGGFLTLAVRSLWLWGPELGLLVDVC